MIAYAIRQYHITCSVLDQILEMDVQGKGLVELLSTRCNKEKFIIRMSLAIQQDLLFGYDVSFLSVLFYGEV